MIRIPAALPPRYGGVVIGYDGNCVVASMTDGEAGWWFYQHRFRFGLPRVGQRIFIRWWPERLSRFSQKMAASVFLEDP